MRVYSLKPRKASRRCVSVFVTAVAYTVMGLGACGPVLAQTNRPGAEKERGGLGGCVPVSERKAELGCYTLATTVLGGLPRVPLYWYLDTYPTRAAAEAVKGTRGTVVESLSKIWLLTIAEADFQSAGGERVAKIGPLPLSSNGEFTAAYMEAIMMPGATAPPHRHPGPEAWYQVSGDVCLETPSGRSVGRTGGEAVIVPGGAPMTLRVIGTEKRRSLVLVLHDSSQPWTTLARDWKPKGLCKN